MWKIFSSHDRAVQIIHPVGKGDLGKRQSHAHPIGGEMLNVIEIDAADREIAELFESGRPWDVGERRALWLEGKRNKTGETSVSSWSSRNCRRWSTLCSFVSMCP